MKKIARWFCMILVFCLDVHVKASENTHKNLKEDSVKKISRSKNSFLSEPKNCYGHFMPCALYLYTEGQTITMGTTQVSLPQGAFIIQKTEKKLRLVKGYVWIETQGPFVVESDYGKIRLKDSKALVRIRNERIELVSVNSNSYLEMFSGEKLLVPEGYENWMGGVTKSGKQFVGFPAAANIQLLLFELGRVYAGDQESLKEKLFIMRKAWKYAVSETGQRNLASIHKRIAEDLAAKQKYRLRRQRIEAENRQLRALFYRKTYGE